MATWIEFIKALFAALFGSDNDTVQKQPSKPKQLRDTDGPVTRTQDGYDAPVATVTVHSSKKLRDKLGYWPEQKATAALANALDEAKINYVIEWGHEASHDTPTEDIYGNDFETVGWWLNKSVGEDADVKVLLMDDGGGVTLGGACLVGGAKMDAEAEVKRSNPAKGNHGFHAMVHEAGHALSVGADADPDTPGSQTYGRSWVENAYWHRTAVVSTDKETENACGEEIVANGEEKRPVMLHNVYSECAVERIRSTLAGKN